LPTLAKSHWCHFDFQNTANTTTVLILIKNFISAVQSTYCRQNSTLKISAPFALLYQAGIGKQTLAIVGTTRHIIFWV